MNDVMKPIRRALLHVNRRILSLERRTNDEVSGRSGGATRATGIIAETAISNGRKPSGIREHDVL
jgi:hypothetical protein